MYYNSDTRVIAVSPSNDSSTMNEAADIGAQSAGPMAKSTENLLQGIEAEENQAL